MVSNLKMIARARRLGLCGLASAAVAAGLLLGSGAAGAAGAAQAVRLGDHARNLTSASARSDAPAQRDVFSSKIVRSALHTLSGDSWQLAKVTCPKGYRPSGGGMGDPQYTGYIDTIDVGSSYPSGRAWIMEVNNWGSTPAYYRVTAVCTTGLGYRVVTLNSTATADSTVFADPECPAGTYANGGGVQSAINLFQGMNSSVWADDNSGNTYWAVAMSNASGTNEPFTAYAICSPYVPTRNTTSQVLMTPGETTLLAVTCTGGTPISGGGLSVPPVGAGEVMYYSYPTSNGWITYFYNGSNTNVDIQTSVMCL